MTVRVGYTEYRFSLPKEWRPLLKQAAREEFRSPHDHVRFLIYEDLIRRGLLKPPGRRE